MGSVHSLMGKIVIVRKIFKRAFKCCKSGGGVSSWESFKAEGRPGWVVGERWLPVGCIEHDCDYGNTWVQLPDHKPRHCLLVTYWPTMNPVRVPDNGYELAHPTIYPYHYQPYWPQGAREFARDMMRDWPRDEKGRWVRKEQR